MNGAGLFPMDLNEFVKVLSVKYYMGTTGVLSKTQKNLLVLVNRGALNYKISHNSVVQNCNRAIILFAPENDITVTASENCIYTVTEFQCDGGFFPEDTKLKYSIIPVTTITRDVFNLYGTYNNLNISEYSSKVKQNLSAFFANAALLVKKDVEIINHFKVEPDLIKKAKNYIDNNYTKNINVSDVAKTVYLSDGYFSKCFTATFGVTPKKYILKKRIQKAQVLLKTTQLTSREIAFTTGFSSPQRFNGVFADIVGVTPLAYRKNNV